MFKIPAFQQQRETQEILKETYNITQNTGEGQRDEKYGREIKSQDGNMKRRCERQ